MNFEDELCDRMRAGVRGTEVDLAALTAGGIAGGTRRVRRRRITQAVAAGTAVVALGGMAAYAARWTGTPADVAGQPPATTTPVQTTAATPQAALQVLLDLLPPGARTAGYEGGWEEKTAQSVWAALKYDGKTDLTVHVGRRLPRATCTPAAQDEHCSQTQLPGGAVLTTVRISAPDHSRDIAWTATVDRRDGVHVVLVQDYDHEVRGDGTPPLPLATMQAIVRSPRWQLRMDETFVHRAEPLFEPRRPAPPSTPPPITSPSPS